MALASPGAKVPSIAEDYIFSRKYLESTFSCRRPLWRGVLWGRGRRKARDAALVRSGVTERVVHGQERTLRRGGPPGGGRRAPAWHPV